ncbi:MAG: D-cysteine desulfhydrase [Desulfofustis sp.]|nr:D-cysteine desulfhydrase [Desulfofustis sp.]NNK15090.1 D-cysteine desulfhydrase [Desulfofustis sp.]
MNLAKIPRRGYLQGPTPIEPLANFSKSLGKQLNIWMKRDDLLPGCGGGNKTRKLDFSFADAIQQGADTIITCGAVQSNHCRLTASWAAKESMDCHLVLEERVKGSYHSDASGNNFLFQVLGTKSISVVPGGSDMMQEMQKVADKLSAAGRKPYIIPGGASNAIGATGYVACAQEMLQQLFEMNLSIDHVVVPSGSAGTHAGMVTGLVGNNAQIPITGINVSRPKDLQEKVVHDLALLTAEKVGVGQQIHRDSVTCFDNYVGPGYSLPTDGMIEAVKLLATTEAILLDPVYSGKTMAGCIDLVRNGYFEGCKNILFLHTGGSPALYAYLDTFR